MNVAIHPQFSFISLCTGGGGLDLGVELAIRDARPVVLVEREAFAVARLVSAMEEGLLAPAPVWDDVRTFNGRPWRGIVDGVIGGIPCQPHSVAGKRLGAVDERDLWADARRIIVQSGAWLVLIENVQGMFSTGGAERVWRDLRRLGFDVEIGLFTSAEVGAPHERMRVFFLAVADARCRGIERWRGAGVVSRTPGKTKDEANQRQWSRHHAGYRGEDVGHPDLARLEGRERGELRERSGERAARATGGVVGNTVRSGLLSTTLEGVHRRQESSRSRHAVRRNTLPLYPPGPSDFGVWQEIIERAPRFEPAVRRMADGMAGRVDQLRMLGNGVNPLQAAYAVRTLATRLARRSAAVKFIVRMMENQHD